MNVLFVLHNDMNCNSASHVDGVARELAGRGLDCVVTVPDPVAIPQSFLDGDAYPVLNYGDYNRLPSTNQDSHVPTPVSTRIVTIAGLFRPKAHRY